ncbi:Protein F46G10.1 a [Aphelenchoides avenae]|nr:Protein F46G10.1 a [Aphelenchus avenae]
MFRIDRSGRVAINPYNVSRDAQGRIFIDRCGKLFRYVLQYMRDGRHTVLPDDATLLKQISREAEFFGVEGLEGMVADRLLISPSSQTELLEKAVHELTLGPSRSQYTR